MQALVILTAMTLVQPRVDVDPNDLTMDERVKRSRARAYAFKHRPKPWGYGVRPRYSASKSSNVYVRPPMRYVYVGYFDSLAYQQWLAYSSYRHHRRAYLRHQHGRSYPY